MLNIIMRFCVIAGLVSIIACESDVTPNNTADIVVTTSSSSSLALSGTYNTACYSPNGTATTESVAFSGDSWTYTTSTYSDAACTGASTDVVIVATMTVINDQQVTRWVNGNGETVDAPTGIVMGVNYTMLNLTVTSSDDTDIVPGFSVGMAYVVDDSDSSGLTLYRMDNAVDGVATIADPFTDIPAPAIQLFSH